MTVYGHEVTEEQEQAMLSVMQNDKWHMVDVEVAARRAGVPNSIKGSWYSILLSGDTHVKRYPANRAADRMLQRERKAGNIRYTGTHWERVEDE